jgi:hypothetical protein
LEKLGTESAQILFLKSLVLKIVIIFFTIEKGFIKNFEVNKGDTKSVNQILALPKTWGYDLQSCSFWEKHRKTIEKSKFTIWISVLPRHKK